MRNVGRKFTTHGRNCTNTKPDKTKQKKSFFRQRRKVSNQRVNDAAMASIEPTKKTSDKSLFERFCMRCENGADWIQIGFLKLVRICYVSFTNDQDVIDELDSDIIKLNNNIRERNGKEKIMKPSRPVVEKVRNGDLAGAGKNLYANTKDKVTGVAEVVTAKAGNLIA